MSRSRRKTPKCGMTCADSEKKDKRLANRRYRRAATVSVQKGNDPPNSNEIINVWTFDKDGKQYIHKGDEYYEEVLRK